MTAIAWDGTSLAVDSGAECCSVMSKCIKFYRGKSYVLAIHGGLTTGVSLMNWFKAGANPDSWPNHQTEECWTGLVVATANGVYEYEHLPIPTRTKDKFRAWGSGRDVALGAMFAGATAKQAVSIACKICTGCAGPVYNFKMR